MSEVSDRSNISTRREDQKENKKINKKERKDGPEKGIVINGIRV